ncbi:MAG: YhcH/YjgK/YiaL family protein [Acidobacteriota bacterium]
MITGSLLNWRATPGLQGLEPAFEFLASKEAETLPVGKHVIEGDEVFALVQQGPTRSPADALFESHRQYVDVQYLAWGTEMIGVSTLAGLEVQTPYDPAKDAALYVVPPDYQRLIMQPGQFAVFFPEDGHLPNCYIENSAEIRKIVVKVSIRRIVPPASQ